MSHDHARMSHASAPDDEATSGSEAAAGPQAAPRADRGARRGTYHVGPDRGWRVGRRRPGQEGPRLHRGEPLPRPDADRDAVHLLPGAAVRVRDQLRRHQASVAAQLPCDRGRLDLRRGRRQVPSRAPDQHADGLRPGTGARSHRQDLRRVRVHHLRHEGHEPVRGQAQPWLYFTPTAERTGCTSYDVPFSSFSGDVAAGTLPNVGLVVPNLCNDAHDCSLGTADAWFQQRMTEIFAGPDWRAGRLVVILTADEAGKGAASNTVLTVVIHPSQSHKVVSTRLTHYSLTRLYEDIAHAPYLRNAASAPSMSAAFGLPIA